MRSSIRPSCDIGLPLEIWPRKRMRRREESDLCDLAAADGMGGMGVRQGGKRGVGRDCPTFTWDFGYSCSIT